MNAEVHSESSTRSVIDISVPATEVAEVRAIVAKEYAAQATLPGFRTGKAPVALVERKFSARISAAAAERSLREAFDKAAKDNSLEIWEFISFDPVDSPEVGGVAAKVTVDLVPKFDLPKIDGIPVDNADTQVSDEEVASRAESIRRSHATYSPLPEGEALAVDDAARIDYTGTVDGKPLAEAIPIGSAFAGKKNAYCTVGSDYFVIPGVAAELVGKKVGDSFETDSEFPADFYIEEMRGAHVHYSVKVVSGEKFVLPELNEEYWKSIGVADGDDLAKQLRQLMEDHAKDVDKVRRLNQIARYLSESVSFDLPQAELDRLSERVLSDLLRVNMDKGIAKEDLSKERERLLEAARTQAAARLRSDFVLDAVVRERKISITPDEFNNYLNVVVRRQGLNPSQVRELAKDRDALRAHHRAALRELALDKLLETAAPSADVEAK